MHNNQKISSEYKQHYKKLILYAIKWLKEEDIAKDVVQAVFVKLLEKPDISHISNYQAYLFQSVRNESINYLKKKSGETGELTESELKTYGYFNDPVEEAEFEAYVFDIINDLPPATKKIFKLNRFEGLSNQQIADQLGLSKRTVELQISKALKVLREKLFDPKNPKTNYSQFLSLLF